MEKAEVKWIGKMGFVARGDSNHRIALDTVTEYGGEDAGVRPLELLLMSLGGCTGMDVVSILRKMKVNFQDFKVTVEAERTDEHPRIYHKIDLRYVVSGDDVPEDKLKKAIELSQDRYCAVTAMLRQTVELTYSYEIASRGGGD